MKIDVLISNSSHLLYVDEILDTIEASAKARGTGIARRSNEYISKKIAENKAIIALTTDGKFAGFSYIEIYNNGEFLVNSGLIVHPDYRNLGLAKLIKSKIFEYSKILYPKAKIFGITTSLPVLKINSELGYKPVTFSELPDDELFWKGCSTCVNYDILNRTNRKMCLCTGMLYNPSSNVEKYDFKAKSKVLERLKRIKQSILLGAKKIKGRKNILSLIVYKEK